MKKKHTEFNLILPRKIVDGFAKTYKTGYKLTVSIDDVNPAKYTRYSLLVMLQKMWDKKQLEDLMQKGFSTGGLDTEKYINVYLQKHPPPPKNAIRPLMWDYKYDEYLTQLKISTHRLSPEAFEEFLLDAKNLINDKYTSHRSNQFAWKILAEFITFFNRGYLLSEYYYSIPAPPKLVKTNPLIIDENWVKNGKQIKQIIKLVHRHWQTTSDYSDKENIAWLVFSGIFYGGINKKVWLAPWVNALLTNQVHPLFDYQIYSHVRFQSIKYGNERTTNNNTIYNTQQFCIDLLSQLWLFRINKSKDSEINKFTLQSIEKLLKQCLSSVLKPYDIKVPNLSFLLKYASYHWEMLPNVFIDQALVLTLQGRQNTTGLTQTAFNKLLNNQYQPVDSSNILLIATSKDNKPNSGLKRESQKIRRSDLVTDLLSHIDKNEGKIESDLSDIKDLEKEISDGTVEQTESIKEINKLKANIHWHRQILNPTNEYSIFQTLDKSELILKSWVLELLQNGQANHESIKKYITAIGYEWIYFTSEQPIERWNDEDFSELYDEIIDYKSIELDNKSVDFSAKLLQRLHNHGVENFGLPKVYIEQAKSKKFVRAEWISPQLYKAILQQLKNSIDSLEIDMFLLLYIMAYRTGMRKKELLGLKFCDIEGLILNQPSVVIRPNAYRSTKTIGSIRRVPLFALLSPQELSFFIEYVQANMMYNQNAYIFSLSSQKEPIDNSIPLQLLKNIITKVSQDDTSFTFHAFRHTAITNLALILNSTPSFASLLTGYSTEHIEQIKHGLLGYETNAQDSWYALSGIMGHLSPQRSFEYYNHVACLMATHALVQADIHLPLKTLTNISAITKKRLKENNVQMNDDEINLKSLNKLLFKESLNRSYRKPVKHHIQGQVDTAKIDIKTSKPDTSKDLVHRYGINQLLAFIRLLDSNKDCLDKDMINYLATDCQILKEDGQTITSNIQEIVQLKTQRGLPRLVNEGSFLPIKIHEKVEYKLLNSLYTNVLNLRNSQPEEYRWYLSLCLKKLTTEKAFITFPQKQKADLERFLAISIQLLPQKHWLLIGNFETKMYPKINIKTVNSNNSLKIGICIPSSKKNFKYSGLLRFIIYILVVCD